MWDAPSDRDYYGHRDEPVDELGCAHCGADETQVCEPHCATNAPAADATAIDEPELKEKAA
jgi:hypothetical protein